MDLIWALYGFKKASEGASEGLHKAREYEICLSV